MLTVKQLARLAGITPRTLHYYDEIGLLKPTQVGGNGYRYYGEETLLQLQQILLYRELEMPLEQIRQIMGRRDFDTLTALEAHQRALRKRVHHYEQIIATVERTIQHLKGDEPMSDSQFFDGFSDEQQAKYEEEIMQKYDPATVRASNKRWKEYSPTEKQRVLEEGKAAYTALVNAIPEGPTSPEAQAGVALWRKTIEAYWIPNEEQLVGLTHLYLEDERFKAFFDRIDPRLAEFLKEAVQAYIANRPSA